VTGATRARLGAALLCASALAGALGLIAVVTGGYRIYVCGIGLSARGPHRAFLIAAVLGALGLTCHVEARERLLTRLRHLPATWFTAAAALLSVLVILLGLLLGTKAPAGADGYGYVSQADLWLAGDLRIRHPLIRQVPWPAADWTFAPLGYRPAADGTIVPSYAPGIPLLMAGLKRAFGEGAEYWLHPLSGGLLVMMTFLTGARLSGSAAGLLAALWTSASPLVLFLTLGLLADLPAAAFWMLSLYLALRSSSLAGITSAAAAACAILIRPNLSGLLLVPALLIWSRAGTRRATAVQLAAFAAGALPAVLFILWLFNDLYGSPLVSGYGENRHLFAADHITVNLRHFVLWTWQSHGLLPFLFPLALRGAHQTSARRARIALIAFVVLNVLSYVSYLSFEDWWYLRFLLPALPVAFVLVTDAAWTLSRPLGDGARFGVLAVFALCTTGYCLFATGERRILESARTSARYEEVGHYVRDRLPANAIVYSMEHSGSIHYYSGRRTLRYDMLDPAWLDRSVAHLEALGYPAYLAIELHEVAAFRARFAGQAAAGALDGPIEVVGQPQVSIVRLMSPSRR
jgi:hypothetical protein